MIRNKKLSSFNRTFWENRHRLNTDLYECIHLLRLFSILHLLCFYKHIAGNDVIEKNKYLFQFQQLPLVSITHIKKCIHGNTQMKQNLFRKPVC